MTKTRFTHMLLCMGYLLSLPSISFCSDFDETTGADIMVGQDGQGIRQRYVGRGGAGINHMQHTLGDKMSFLHQYNRALSIPDADTMDKEHMQQMVSANIYFLRYLYQVNNWSLRAEESGVDTSSCDNCNELVSNDFMSDLENIYADCYHQLSALPLNTICNDALFAASAECIPSDLKQSVQAGGKYINAKMLLLDLKLFEGLDSYILKYVSSADSGANSGGNDWIKQEVISIHQQMKDILLNFYNQLLTWHWQFKHAHGQAHCELIDIISSCIDSAKDMLPVEIDDRLIESLSKEVESLPAVNLHTMDENNASSQEEI